MVGDAGAGSQVASYWSRLAPGWDAMLSVVGLHRRYRRETVSVLDLHKGDTVLDAACGTGLNFPLLYAAVGPRGRIVAVDIARGMLDMAKERANREGYDNVEMVLGDMARVTLPPVDGAVASWCMISIPDYREALENIVSVLRPGGGVSILDFKLVDGFPGPIVNPIFAAICRLTRQDATRQPWVDLKEMVDAMAMREWRLAGLLSSVYLAWGKKPLELDAPSNPSRHGTHR